MTDPRETLARIKEQADKPVDGSAEVLREWLVWANRDCLELVGALQAVLDLHQPEKRWMPHRDADVSFDSEQEALDHIEDNTGLLHTDKATYFEVCAHCKTVEDGPCEGQCTSENGYLESLWPCPTYRAITDQLGDES